MEAPALPISVVIPTRGRPSQVVDAVMSALDQTRPPQQVVVVVDGVDHETIEALATLDHPALEVHQHSRSSGASAARNTGVRAATGRWIAFLDDDDTWMPTKLERQWVRIEHDPEHLVVGCAVRWRRDSDSPVWPLRAPRPAEPVAEYLFCRREAGEGLLPTPGLVVPRELACRHPFDERLSVHEDLDWLLALEAGGARFDVVLEPLAEVDGRSARTSLSHSSSWHQTLAWALSHRDRLGPAAFSGFCATEVARAARSDRAGVRAALVVLLVASTGAFRGRQLATLLAIMVLPESWRHGIGRVRRRSVR